MFSEPDSTTATQKSSLHKLTVKRLGLQQNGWQQAGKPRGNLRKQVAGRSFTTYGKPSPYLDSFNGLNEAQRRYRSVPDTGRNDAKSCGENLLTARRCSCSEIGLITKYNLKHAAVQYARFVAFLKNKK